MYSLLSQISRDAKTITFAVQDLCLHPSYKEPLRQELLTNFENFKKTATGLPLLDSFIKESARLTPVESSTSVPFPQIVAQALQTKYLCTSYPTLK